jgi:hypothetical protein
MEILSALFEGNAVKESTDLATWNRPRTNEELRSFINNHHDRLPEGIEIE